MDENIIDEFKVSSENAEEISQSTVVRREVVSVRDCSDGARGREVPR